MSSQLIRYIKPVLPLPEEWVPYLKESYASGYFANFGPAVREFERRLCDKYARNRAVVTAPNATNGLTVALQALGVRGKVVTPAYTFPATAQAILMAGCIPKFCDISESSWELAPGRVEQALQDAEVGAVMHVRAYGFAHDLRWLEELTQRRGVPLIVDAAAAIGGAASLQGHVGHQGEMEVFSFHATKVFGIGEGGATFSAPRHEQALREASNFGIRYPDVAGRGQNSKMSDLQAAVGLAVLDRIDGYVTQRQSIVHGYHRALSSLPWIKHVPDPALSPWQSYPVQLSAGQDVPRIMARAQEAGLELKRGYYSPLHRTRKFSAYAEGQLPVTDIVSPNVICLPVYSDMPSELADLVLQLFAAAVG